MLAVRRPRSDNSSTTEAEMINAKPNMSRLTANRILQTLRKGYECVESNTVMIWMDGLPEI